MFTTKPTLVLLALVATVVLSVGYIMALAILAPQQLAEATTAASDVVCNECIGTTDIANSAVTTTKIGSGQVGTSDIASSAVTSAKIGSGQVLNSDIATSAVSTGKISDTNGVYSVDIVNGQVGSTDIADGQVTSADIKDSTITSTDLASDTIRVNHQLVIESGVNVEPGENISTTADCLDGYFITGGGFVSEPQIQVFISAPLDVDTWMVQGINEGETSANLAASVACIDPTAP